MLAAGGRYVNAHWLKMAARLERADSISFTECVNYNWRSTSLLEAGQQTMVPFIWRLRRHNCREFIVQCDVYIQTSPKSKYC